MMREFCAVIKRMKMATLWPRCQRSAAAIRRQNRWTTLMKRIKEAGELSLKSTNK